MGILRIIGHENKNSRTSLRDSDQVFLCAGAPYYREDILITCVRGPSWKVLLFEIKNYCTQLGVCCVSRIRVEAVPTKRARWNESANSQIK